MEQFSVQSTQLIVFVTQSTAKTVKKTIKKRLKGDEKKINPIYLQSRSTFLGDRPIFSFIERKVKSTLDKLNGKDASREMKS